MNKITKEQIREAVSRVVQKYESQIVASQASASPAQAPATEQTSNNPTVLEYFAPWTGEVYLAVHPSQQQFSVGNSTESIVSSHGSSEQCTIEKGKPCDQCGACRVLGF